jgi:hypothetical protein
VRFLKVLVIIVLVGSVLLNILLYRKNERLRPQIVINNKTITKKDYHDWLEQHNGTEMMAAMVKYNLFMQAAEKAGIKPDPEEVQQEIKDWKEMNPEPAARLESMPWRKDDLQQQVEMQLAAVALTTKDVKVTDDELRDYFNSLPGKWDIPTKLHVKAMKAADLVTADTAKQNIEQIIGPTKGSAKPGDKVSAPDLKTLVQQFAPKLGLLYVDGTWILRKPFDRPSNDTFIDTLAGMHPGDVHVFPIPNGNGNALVVVLESIEPGRKSALEEPAIKKKVEREFKTTRSQPVQELLRTLWDAATIKTDPEGAKVDIEHIILPERFKPELAGAQ